MELTIEHLAAYLPYGLKGKMNIFGDNQTEVGIEGLSVIGEVELSGIRTTVNEFFDISEIKPILRTLSDLTKEIEVNGEKFVPIERLKELFILDKSKCCDAYQTAFRDIYFDFTEADFKAKILMLPNEWVEVIHSWHFDTKGLIEAGLAINYNELNK